MPRRCCLLSLMSRNSSPNRLRIVAEIQHFWPCFSGVFVDQKSTICYTKNMIKAHPNTPKRSLATLVLMAIAEFSLIFCVFYAVFG